MKNWVRTTGLVIFIAIMSMGCGHIAVKMHVEREFVPGPGDVTLDRLFDSSDFRGGFFGPARWLADGSGYSTLEKSEDVDEGRDIVLYNPATGEREVLVPANKLIPVGEEKPLGLSNYSWSEDGRQLMIFTNTKRVWRSNSRGDYWVLNLDNWDLKQLGGDAGESTLMFAKFSSDGERAAYVMKNNIYVENIFTGKIIQLTRDGNDNIINGTFDWVYEEEFGLRDGFRWSPDGKSIAYWQLDQARVPVFTMINNTDELYPTLTTFPYPKAGEINATVRVGVVPSTGGRTTWMKIDEGDYYIARMEWADNSDEITMQYINRRQDRITLLMGNASTGLVTNIFEEFDEAWVDAVNDMQWLEGEAFTWPSERDGWRHLYTVSRDGSKINLVTPGEFDVISLLRVDPEAGWVYFIASPENPTQRYLYRQSMGEGNTLERLTPADQPGNHRYSISANGEWAFHYYSKFGTPSVTELISLPDHAVKETLVDNAKLKAMISSLNRGSVDFFRVTTSDDVVVDGWMMLPPNFNPKKKYPMLLYVYGEPWGQTGQDVYGGRNYLWHLMLTQRGYIVATVDNRGTPSPRGRAWRKSAYKQIGPMTSRDQAYGVKALQSKRAYLDPTRVAIWGWSGGGSSTLNGMFRHGDVFSTGMSVAPVPDQRLYDSIYQERYSGLLPQDEESYEEGSPVTFAKNLTGNLLVVHGTGDDNVHYQGTQRLINELVKHNKPFTMMAYPNRSHGIREGKGTSRHVFELLTRYLMENMPAN